ncbi:NADP-dependent oxidoreductase [Rothia terrae]|uniref:NADP-dependent oxidoreductase n=1 Tax=Rothia terrae TaxID=396015 RepID=A0A7H2BCY0_9MICC|nr:NADP-dependent oxidoreductase [Rothia terrae]MDT0189715.1 NADP-dependent oxidoreductase [Rothia terrae]NKZ33730.1 NADP-dependent oxidoreductase [Rothia terrae]QNV37526.1 NADP-dependent oxidoreductase [Rothia terrae]
MRAFVLTHYGQDGIELQNVPAPRVGEHDVLIRVKATSVNPVDTMIRDGKFKPILSRKLPMIMGNDVAGVVIEVGSQVAEFSVGDEVYARPQLNSFGTFADEIAIHEDAVAHKPESLSMNEAAALPLVSLTAWQALTERSSVREGTKVLIHGGTGGVGSAAIQLAKALGAHVATTVSGSKADLARELGADLIIDYRTQNFEDVVSGYDVVLDTQGGETLEKSLGVLAPGGIAISIVGPPTPDFAAELKKPVLKLPMWAMSRKMFKRAKQLGVGYEFLLMHSSGAQLEKMTELVEAGKFKPVIGKVFPFEKTLEAIDFKADKGKVVIEVEQ